MQGGNDRKVLGMGGYHPQGLPQFVSICQELLAIEREEQITSIANGFFLQHSWASPAPAVMTDIVDKHVTHHVDFG